MVHRLHSNVYDIDNVSDNRDQEHSLELSGHGGLIGLLGSTVNLAIEGNRLYDTGGIYVMGACLPVERELAYSYFNEIRGNLVQGKQYNAAAKKPYNGLGGIYFWYAGDKGDLPTGDLGYADVIVGNTVDDAWYGDNESAIMAIYAYTAPATPYAWKNLIIEQNTIRNVEIGLNIVTSYFWYTILSGNTFSNVTTSIVDKGTGTVQL